jgi:hypothetical protein
MLSFPLGLCAQTFSPRASVPRPSAPGPGPEAGSLENPGTGVNPSSCTEQAGNTDPEEGSSPVLGAHGTSVCILEPPVTVFSPLT